MDDFTIPAILEAGNRPALALALDQMVANFPVEASDLLKETSQNAKQISDDVKLLYSAIDVLIQKMHLAESRVLDYQQTVANLLSNIQSQQANVNSAQAGREPMNLNGVLSAL